MIDNCSDMAGLTAACSHLALIKRGVFNKNSSNFKRFLKRLFATERQRVCLVDFLAKWIK
jgi:hypothetical protein